MLETVSTWSLAACCENSSKSSAWKLRSEGMANDTPSRTWNCSVKHHTFHSDVAVLSGITFEPTTMHELSSTRSTTSNIVLTVPEINNIWFAAESNETASLCQFHHSIHLRKSNTTSSNRRCPWWLEFDLTETVQRNMIQRWCHFTSTEIIPELYTLSQCYVFHACMLHSKIRSTPACTP
jgi:hypothetical protein